MPFEYEQISKQEFDDLLATFIGSFEGIKARPYADTHQNSKKELEPHPSIGIGADLMDAGARQVIFSVMNITDKKMIEKLTNAINDGLGKDTKQIQKLLDDAYGKSFTMTRDQMLSAYEKMISSYVTTAQNFSKLGYSKELAVLTSLSFNGLVGDKLKAAMLEPDPVKSRAEAWFETRFNHAPQNIKRRYMEGAILGLFSDPKAVSLDDAVAVYQVLSKHYKDRVGGQANMLEYDKKYAAEIKFANIDLAAIADVNVQSIAGELKPATSVIMESLFTSKHLTLPGVLDPLGISVDDSGKKFTFKQKDNKGVQLPDAILTLQEDGGEILHTTDQSGKIRTQKVDRLGGEITDYRSDGAIEKKITYGVSGWKQESYDSEGKVVGLASFDTKKYKFVGDIVANSSSSFARGGENDKEHYSLETTRKGDFEFEATKGDKKFVAAKVGKIITGSYSNASENSSIIANGRVIDYQSDTTSGITEYHLRRDGSESGTLVGRSYYESSDATIDLGAYRISWNKDSLGNVSFTSNYGGTPEYPIFQKIQGSSLSLYSNRPGVLPFNIEVSSDEHGNPQVGGRTFLGFSSFTNGDRFDFNLGHFEIIEDKEIRTDVDSVYAYLDGQVENRVSTNHVGVFNSYVFGPTTTPTVVGSYIQLPDGQLKFDNSLNLANEIKYLDDSKRIEYEYDWGQTTYIIDENTKYTNKYFDGSLSSTSWGDGDESTFIDGTTIHGTGRSESTSSVDFFGNSTEIAIDGTGIRTEIVTSKDGITLSVEKNLLANGTIIQVFDEVGVEVGTKRIAGSESLRYTGTNFSDEIYGSFLADEIIGGAGNDIIDGKQGVNLIVGGTGDDTIFSSGEDTLLFDIGDGHDELNFSLLDHDTGTSQPPRKILLGTGISEEDVSVRKRGSDLLISVGSIADQILVRDWFGEMEISLSLLFQNGIEWDSATIKSEILQATSKADNIEGLSVDDYIKGEDGADVIYGYDGNDRIDGGAGDDLIDGGSGDDILSGGAGNDIFIFGAGSGTDTIIDWRGNNNDSDFVLLGKEISPNDIILSRSQDDLLIKLEGSKDSLNILNYFGGDLSGENKIKFFDGSFLSEEMIFQYFLLSTEDADWIVGTAASDIIDAGDGDDSIFGMEGNDVIKGGKGNDWLDGGNGSDTFVYGKGDGSDIIANQSPDAIDVLLFNSNIKFEDVKISRNRSDLFISISGTVDSITLMGWFDSVISGHEPTRLQLSNGYIWNSSEILANLSTATSGNDYLIARQGISVLEGLDGDDVLDANDLDVDLDGGNGDDILIGGEGKNNYIFSGVFGNDIIKGWGNGTDTILFGSDVISELVQIYSSTDDLIIQYGDYSITITDYFDSSTQLPKLGILRFINGVEWNSTEIIQRLQDPVFTEDSDEVTIHKNSPVYTLGGDDLIRIGQNAIIYAGSGNDRISATHGNRDFVDAGDGNDIISMYISTDSNLWGGDGNDRINLNRSDRSFIFGGDGDDDISLYGGEFNNVSAGTGADRITLYENSYSIVHGDDGSDRFLVTGNNNEIHGGDGDDIFDWGVSRNSSFYGEAGNDEIKLSAGSFSNILFGGDGNDKIFSDGMFDSMYGGDGDDTLKSNNSTLSTFYGGNGNDVVEIVGNSNNIRGESGDDILKINYGDGNKISGGDGDDLITVSSGSDNIIFSGSGKDTIFVGYGTGAIFAGSGDDSITIGAADQFVAGGTGDDQIISVFGKDIFAFNQGDGNDVIELQGGIGATLSLGLGFDNDKIKISRDEMNLVFSLDDNDSIVFKNWYADGISHKGVANLQLFTNNTNLTPDGDDVQNAVISNIFDFKSIVNDFDSARRNYNGVSGWSISDSLLTAHLSSSDTYAIGGDLAASYAQGKILESDDKMIHSVVSDPRFGNSNQKF